MACRTKVPFKTLPLSAPVERAFKIKQFQKEGENNTGQSRFYIFSFCNSVQAPLSQSIQERRTGLRKRDADTGRLAKIRVGYLRKCFVSTPHGLGAEG